MTSELNSNTIVITEISLLSMQEFKQYSNIIPNITNDEKTLYWLKSPNRKAGDQNRVMVATDLGEIYYFGYPSKNKMFVRPCIRVKSAEKPSFRPIDTVDILGVMWTVLSVKGTEMFLIADEYIGNEIFDENSNDFEKSYISGWLIGWLSGKANKNILE